MAMETFVTVAVRHMQAEMPTGETEDSYLLTLTLSSDKKGKVTLTDAAFTPMWTYLSPPPPY